MDRANAVIAVTADTGGDLQISTLEQFAVNACGIFALLIYSKPGSERLHEFSRGGTLSAEGRQLCRFWLPYEPLPPVHGCGHVILGRITPVTIDAGQAARVMHIAL